MRRLAFALATALATATPQTQAETLNTSHDLPKNPKTVAYLYSRPMMEGLYRLGVMQDRKFGLQTECKTQYQVKPYSIAILAPIEFPDGKPHPTQGIWNFRYQFDRCGETKVYNAIFMANDNGQPPATRPYYPGMSNADPLLIKDTMTGALMSAMLRSGLKDCKEIDVFDMALRDAPEGDRPAKGAWKETWTFRLCGQMVEVPITFTPNPATGGTGYTIDPIAMSEGKLAP